MVTGTPEAASAACHSSVMRVPWSSGRVEDGAHVVVAEDGEEAGDVVGLVVRGDDEIEAAVVEREVAAEGVLDRLHAGAAVDQDAAAARAFDEDRIALADVHDGDAEASAIGLVEGEPAEDADEQDEQREAAGGDEVAARRHSGEWRRLEDDRRAGGEPPGAGEQRGVVGDGVPCRKAAKGDGSAGHAREEMDGADHVLGGRVGDPGSDARRARDGDGDEGGEAGGGGDREEGGDDEEVGERGDEGDFAELDGGDGEGEGDGGEGDGEDLGEGAGEGPVTARSPLLPRRARGDMLIASSRRWRRGPLRVVTPRVAAKLSWKETSVAMVGSRAVMMAAVMSRAKGAVCWRPETIERT